MSDRRRPILERRRRSPWRGIAAVVGVALAFVLGIGLGKALHDNPAPGGTQTLIRTLTPLGLVPVARDTVTITTSGP